MIIHTHNFDCTVGTVDMQEGDMFEPIHKFKRGYLVEWLSRVGGDYDDILLLGKIVLPNGKSYLAAVKEDETRSDPGVGFTLVSPMVDEEPTAGEKQS